MLNSYFSPNYATARGRFRKAAVNHASALFELPVSAAEPAQGWEWRDSYHVWEPGRTACVYPQNYFEPASESLTIDIAWLGSRQPRKALVHVCGIHGVEGFAGSAVQLALLDRPVLTLPEDMAMILVHVLNPYGMAHLRRANENNVDLNRNFFLGEAGWRGAPAGYATLDRFLNPPYPPARISSFHLRLLLAELSLGGTTIRQAVAGGQYDFPKGIFFGGATLEKEPRLYAAWLQDQLSCVENLFVIDLHTGLGPFGRDTLLLRSSERSSGELSRALGLPVATDSDETEVMGYEHAGGHSGLYRQALPRAKVIQVTQEFGTYNGRRLLRALRAENQYHHHGSGGGDDHWSKHILKERFCPNSTTWQTAVLKQGVELAIRAGAFLASPARGEVPG